MDRSKNRGFTLIELSVVVIIMVLMAALIMPSMSRMKAQRAARAFIPDLRKIAVRARLEAIDQQQTMMLTWDQTQGVVSLIAVPSTVTSSTGTGAATGGTAGSNQTGSNSTENRVVTTIPVPATVSATSFEVGDNPAQNPDWEIHFYPDGTCEGGGVEFTDSNGQMHLSLSKRGIGQITTGALPTGTNTEWTAGDFERRQ